MKSRQQLVPRAIVVLSVAYLVGCSPAIQSGSPSPALDPKVKAAAEATALIQSAEATAIVMKAQAMATTLVQNASVPGSTSIPAIPTPTPGLAPVATLKPQTAQVTDMTLPTPTRADLATVTSLADEPQVQLVGVTIAPETGFIVVRFRAPPSVAQKWQQGMVYVIDEATNTQYSAIPIAPLIGALFGRPKYEGQIGYVMFINTPPPGLGAGSVVTVVLGDFRQEHVIVQAPQ